MHRSVGPTTTQAPFAASQAKPLVVQRRFLYIYQYTRGVRTTKETPCFPDNTPLRSRSTAFTTRLLPPPRPRPANERPHATCIPLSTLKAKQNARSLMKAPLHNAEARDTWNGARGDGGGGGRGGGTRGGSGTQRSIPGTQLGISHRPLYPGSTGREKEQQKKKVRAIEVPHTDYEDEVRRKSSTSDRLTMERRCFQVFVSICHGFQETV